MLRDRRGGSPPQCGTHSLPTAAAAARPPQFGHAKATAQLKALMAKDSDFDEYEAKFTALVEADKAAAEQARAPALPAGDGRSWNAAANRDTCPPTDISPNCCCLHSGPGPG